MQIWENAACCIVRARARRRNSITTVRFQREFYGAQSLRIGRGNTLEDRRVRDEKVRQPSHHSLLRTRRQVHD